MEELGEFILGEIKIKLNNILVISVFLFVYHCLKEITTVLSLLAYRGSGSPSIESAMFLQ